ncbi:hypothetical protein [Paraburkholderia bannensis]|uniref:hypothetical protein n=1 Tax=Paraburkholderia bannensis TaxID=765414 RepID=UPI002ABDB8C5|nr:hypothetical protein [Paraburkholderia bannensis]
MMSFKIVGAALAACVVSISACAAQPLVPGTRAPADVVQNLKNAQSVTIGAASVRAVSSGSASQPASNVAATESATAQTAPKGGETTTVVRESDNLVGVSSNDLVVIYPDTAAVSQALSGKPVSVKVWANMGIVVVHASTFDQLMPLKTALSQKFPAAKFDLPVKYFDTVPQ